MLLSINCNLKEFSPTVKVKRELLWYDTIRQEMQFFEGGNLKYVYKEDPYIVKMSSEEKKRKNISSTYRLLPEVEDLEIVDYGKKEKKSDKIKIMGFIKKYSYDNYVKIDIIAESDAQIIVNIKEEDKDEFSYQLEEIGIRTVII